MTQSQYYPRGAEPGAVNELHAAKSCTTLHPRGCHLTESPLSDVTAGIRSNGAHIARGMGRHRPASRAPMRSRWLERAPCACWPAAQRGSAGPAQAGWRGGTPTQGRWSGLSPLRAKRCSVNVHPCGTKTTRGSSPLRAETSGFSAVRCVPWWRTCSTRLRTGQLRCGLATHRPPTRVPSRRLLRPLLPQQPPFRLLFPLPPIRPWAR